MENPYNLDRLTMLNIINKYGDQINNFSYYEFSDRGIKFINDVSYKRLSFVEFDQYVIKYNKAIDKNKKIEQILEAERNEKMDRIITILSSIQRALKNLS